MSNNLYTTPLPNRRLAHVTSRIYQPAGPALSALADGGSRYMFGNVYYVLRVPATKHSDAFVGVMRVSTAGKASCVYAVSLYAGRSKVNKALYDRATRYARLRAQGYSHTEAVSVVHHRGDTAMWHYFRVRSALWATACALMDHDPDVAHSKLQAKRHNGYKKDKLI